MPPATDASALTPAQLQTLQENRLKGESALSLLMTSSNHLLNPVLSCPAIASSQSRIPSTREITTNPIERPHERIQQTTSPSDPGIQHLSDEPKQATCPPSTYPFYLSQFRSPIRSLFLLLDRAFQRKGSTTSTTQEHVGELRRVRSLHVTEQSRRVLVARGRR